MKFSLDKLSFVLGNALGAAVVGLVIAACGAGGNENSATPAVSARQIVFTDSSGNLVAISRGRFVKVAAADVAVDPTIHVLATNVNLDTSSNTVTESNLQDALNNQIAFDLAKALPGTTWSIANTAAHDYNGNNVPGSITFNRDGTFTLNSGMLCAAANAITQSSAGSPPLAGANYMTTGSGSFSVIGENALTMGFSVTVPGAAGTTTNEFTVLHVISKSKRQITLASDFCVAVLTPSPGLSS
jgi:hypothetical protein